MTHLNVDSGFMERPEVFSLSDKAFRLHFSALLYMSVWARAERSILDDEIAQYLRRRIKARRSHIQELEDFELWTPVGRGWQLSRIHVPREQRRPNIPKDVRREVYLRDGFECLICGSSDRLTLDHIVPFSAGGADTVDNLRTLCHSCNARRGAARRTDEELRGTA